MKIITKPKEWGNSLGIIIPKEIVKKNKITTETMVTIDIKKENPLKELFGILKDFKIDAQKVKDEIREGERIAEKRKWGG